MRLQVVDDLVGRRCVAGAALRRCTGHPDAAAGQCGGTAELAGLLDDQRGQPGGLRGQRGRHAATAGADDQHIDLIVERVGSRHAAITAVLIAKPAINSGTGR